MKRYQIVAIYPEDEQPTFHVFDTGLELEVAILDTEEQARLFREIRERVDGSKTEQLYLN